MAELAELPPLTKLKTVRQPDEEDSKERELQVCLVSRAGDSKIQEKILEDLGTLYEQEILPVVLDGRNSMALEIFRK